MFNVKLACWFSNFVTCSSAFLFSFFGERKFKNNSVIVRLLIRPFYELIIKPFICLWWYKAIKIRSQCPSTVIRVHDRWPVACWDWEGWGSIPACGMYVSFVNVVCSQVEVSATGISHVQRSPTDCGVSI
jgi:hypothetical protein